MTNENTQTETATENKGPDFIAMQYRVVRVEDGWKSRKDRIGAAWRREDGGFLFRPSGEQIIRDDVYFFPADKDDTPA